MSSKTLWCALVIKDNLQDKQMCYDIAYTYADDLHTAALQIKKACWSHIFWVENKSICRVIKLFPVTDQLRRKDLSKEIKRMLAPALETPPEAPEPEATPTRRRRRSSPPADTEEAPAAPTTRRRRRRG